MEEDSGFFLFILFVFCMEEEEVCDFKFYYDNIVGIRYCIWLIFFGGGRVVLGLFWGGGVEGDVF